MVVQGVAQWNKAYKVEDLDQVLPCQSRNESADLTRAHEDLLAGDQEGGASACVHCPTRAPQSGHRTGGIRTTGSRPTHDRYTDLTRASNTELRVGERRGSTLSESGRLGKDKTRNV